MIKKTIRQWLGITELSQDLTDLENAVTLDLENLFVKLDKVCKAVDEKVVKLDREIKNVKVNTDE